MQAVTGVVPFTAAAARPHCGKSPTSWLQICRRQRTGGAITGWGFGITLLCTVLRCLNHQCLAGIKHALHAMCMHAIWQAP